ncbi:uncharacterized protein LOC144862815 [Branchiostoma floridae x Branchiostoma japonicum]
MQSGRRVISGGSPTVNTRGETTTEQSVRLTLQPSLTPCPVVEICSNTNPSRVENPVYIIQTCGYGRHTFPPKTGCNLSLSAGKYDPLFIKFLNLNISEGDTLKIYSQVQHSLNASTVPGLIRVQNYYSVYYKSAKAMDRPTWGWRALVYAEVATEAEMKRCMNSTPTVPCVPQRPSSWA